MQCRRDLVTFNLGRTALQMMSAEKGLPSSKLHCLKLALEPDAAAKIVTAGTKSELKDSSSPRSNCDANDKGKKAN
jgi:hypothetical protein